MTEQHFKFKLREGEEKSLSLLKKFKTARQELSLSKAAGEVLGFLMGVSAGFFLFVCFF